MSVPVPPKLPEKLISSAVNEVFPRPEAVLPNVMVAVPALSVSV